ncbi:MAG: tetratricopeptide repeat protein, partial [Planctomycetota bacterium]
MKFAFSLIIFLIVALCCIYAEESPEEYLELADKAVLNGNYDDAYNLYDKYINLVEKPDFIYYSSLMKLNLTTGNYKKVADLKGDTIETETPQLIEIITLKAEALMNTGKYSEAAASLESALEKDKNSICAAALLAKLKLIIGNKNEAIELYKQIVINYSSNRLASIEESVAAAVAYTMLDKYEEAKGILGNVIDNFPECYEAALLRGKLFFDKYDYPYAIKHFEIVLETNPNHPKANLMLAKTLVKLQENREKNFHNAINLANKALRHNSNLIEAYNFIAFYKAACGNYSEAKQIIEKSLSINPNSLETLGLSAGCALLEGLPENYKTALDKAKTINKKCASTLLQATLLLETRNRYKEAINLSLEAIKLDSDYTPAYLTTAMNLMRIGEEKEAKKYFEKSHDKDAFNVWSYNSLQLLDYMKENFTEKSSEKVIIRAPENLGILLPYITKSVEESLNWIKERYNLVPKESIILELFDKPEFFATRLSGLPVTSNTAVCFGNVVVQQFGRGWHQTLHNQIVYSSVLLSSRNCVPVWFAEAISKNSEKSFEPIWREEWER